MKSPGVESIGADDLLALYESLTSRSLEGPRDFADAVTTLLVEHLSLSAASLYISSPKGRSHRLRAHRGFRAAPDLEVSGPSFVAEAARRRTIVTDSDPLSSELFQAKAVLAGKDIAGLVAVPLRKPQQSLQLDLLAAAPRVFAVVCLYPRRGLDLDAVAEVAASVAPFLSRLYLAAIEHRVAALRQMAIAKFAFSKDAPSLAHKFVRFVREEGLDVDDASLWILDAQASKLYLSRTTGVRGAHAVDRIDVPRPDEDRSIQSDDLGRAFAENRMVVATGGRTARTVAALARERGRPGGQAWNTTFVPIPLAYRGYSASGVVVLHNHSARVGGRTAPMALTWEERYVATYLCELISVLLFQILRTKDNQADYERAMHGSRTVLAGARDRLQEFLDFAGDTHPSQLHRVENALYLIEDLWQQVHRSSIDTRHDVTREPFRLYGDVLAKYSSVVHYIVDRYSVRPMAVYGLAEMQRTFRLIPEVMGNRIDASCVVRNLVDNSVKYQSSNPSLSPYIRFSVSSSLRTVRLSVEDNGIGIPVSVRGRVFEDGTRGVEASRLHPQSRGIGLYDCKRLMDESGGTIALDPRDDVTVFHVDFPRAQGVR